MIVSMNPPNLTSDSLSTDTIRRVDSVQEQAAEIGKQFEAMLIQQVVQAARDASGGWLDDEASQSSEAAAQMGEEFLAKAIAARNGFGLGRTLAASIERTLAG